MTDFVFGCGGEDWLRKAVGFAEATGEFDAADGAGLLIIFPAGAGEVAADDTLDGEHLRALDQHAAAIELPDKRLQFGGEVRCDRSDEMVRNGGLQEVEPEERQLRQYLPLVGNAAAEDMIKSRDAIGGDEEKFVVGERVDIADLAAGGEGKGTKVGLEKGCGHHIDGTTSWTGS